MNPGGDRTLHQIPSVVCFTDRHTGLFVVGIFFSYAVVKAPSQICDPSFARRFKFIYFKFRPNRWWYGILLTMRSLFIALVVVMIPDDPQIQYLLMQLLLTAFAFSHIMLLPFEDPVGNFL